jgi:hypothetical protein
MSIHKTTPEFNATFNYVCVPQSFAADGRQMDTVDFPDSPANTTACELALETPWLLQHTLYQYAIQDIVNHWQAIDATQPVSTRLSDRSIVRTFLQTYGLWEVDQPKGVWASMRFFVRFLLAYGQFISGRRSTDDCAFVPQRVRPPRLYQQSCRRSQPKGQQSQKI